MTPDKDNIETVRHLALGGALDDEMAEELLGVNDADPVLAQWLIATIGGHVDPFFNYEYTTDVPLDRQAFDNLCLYALHCLGTASGFVPRAADDTQVQDFLLQTASGLSPDGTPGLYEAHMYLGRAPAPVGQAVVEDLQGRDKNVKKLTVEDWTEIRRGAEEAYMQDFSGSDELTPEWFGGMREEAGLTGCVRHVADAGGHKPAVWYAGNHTGTNSMKI